MSFFLSQQYSKLYCIPDASLPKESHDENRSSLAAAPLVFSHPLTDPPARTAMADGATADRARHISVSARPSSSTSASRAVLPV
ncbi:hypothetical protein [Amycolatopsis pigmentata]|uniref:Uncharacterized protein n=1 Tax=Amycolatopsis pigmentata TaxID=450801 RepID=A0ABW5G4B8_9PSEU